MRRYLIPMIAWIVGCGPRDPTLATVGNESITQSEFLKEVEGVPFTSQAYLRSPAGRKELLDLLIRRKVILAEARHQRPTDDFKKRMSALTAEYREKQKALRQSFTEEQERLWVGHYTLALRGGALKVTDDDVRHFWETQREVRAAHILLSDRAKAQEVSRRLNRGESFEALAKECSEDPNSASRGGDTGYLTSGSLVPEFENALFRLNPDEVSTPVASPYGFHIIRRRDDRALRDSPFDDAMKDRLRRALESQRLQTWFDKALPRHRVRIHGERLTAVAFPPPPTDGAK